MKRITAIFLYTIIAINISAQTDTTKIGTKNKNIITVIEDDNSTRVIAGNERGVEVITDDHGDTTHIRIGRRTFKIIDADSGTQIKISREVKSNKETDGFNPHWAGLEFGVNMFHTTSYSLYSHMNSSFPQNFMDLHNGKSITVNLNFAEFAFKNRAENFGVVTGLGISFMDFALDNPVTIEKSGDNGIIMPVELNPEGLKKTKLNVSYLTAPLMLEVKTPLRMGSSRLYLAGGVIGGLNIGSHTKYKYRNNKEKLRSNFNLNQFKYDLTGRIGFGDFTLFVNYGMTPLFKESLGPELKTVTFGFSFPNI